MHSSDVAIAVTPVEDRSSKDLGFDALAFLADTVRALASRDYVEAENALFMLRDRVEVLADRQRYAAADAGRGRGNGAPPLNVTGQLSSASS